MVLVEIHTFIMTMAGSIRCMSQDLNINQLGFYLVSIIRRFIPKKKCPIFIQGQFNIHRMELVEILMSKLQMVDLLILIWNIENIDKLLRHLSGATIKFPSILKNVTWVKHPFKSLIGEIALWIRISKLKNSLTTVLRN